MHDVAHLHHGHHVHMHVRSRAAVSGKDLGQGVVHLRLLLQPPEAYVQALTHLKTSFEDLRCSPDDCPCRTWTTTVHFDGTRDGDVVDADGLHPRTDEDRLVAVAVDDGDEADGDISITNSTTASATSTAIFGDLHRRAGEDRPHPAPARTPSK